MQEAEKDWRGNKSKILQNFSQLPETSASWNSCLTILSRRDYFGQHYMGRKRQKNNYFWIFLMNSRFLLEKKKLKNNFLMVRWKTFVRYWTYRILFVWKAKSDGKTHWINLKPNLQGFLLWIPLSPRKSLTSCLTDFIPLGNCKRAQ